MTARLSSPTITIRGYGIVAEADQRCQKATAAWLLAGEANTKNPSEENKIRLSRLAEEKDKAREAYYLLTGEIFQAA